MAEVEEMAREFEELPSGSPPPPYVERNDETLSGRVAIPPTYTAPSLGLTSTEPQLNRRDIAPPDYSTLMQVVAAISCWFCICTLPCAIAAMALEKKAYATSKQGKAKQGKFLRYCVLTLAVITLVIGFLGHFIGWLMVALYIGTLLY